MGGNFQKQGAPTEAEAPINQIHLYLLSIMAGYK